MYLPTSKFSFASLIEMNVFGLHGSDISDFHGAVLHGIPDLPSQGAVL